VIAKISKITNEYPLENFPEEFRFTKCSWSQI